MPPGGKKRVPEFLCPVKYRAGLPEHTAILPFLFPTALPSMAALLEYGPSRLESQESIVPPFDPFTSQLADFTDLDRFVAGAVEDAATPQATEHRERDAAVAPPTDALDNTTSDAEERHTVHISSTPIVLTAFDHDPGLDASHRVDFGDLDLATGARSVVIYTSGDVKVGEWEARELSKTEHDYFVVEGDTAYLVAQRFQLRRRRH